MESYLVYSVAGKAQANAYGPEMSKARKGYEMKVGDLTYVNSTSTGDNPWVVELYRTRDPVLLVEIRDDIIDGQQGWATILHNGEYKYLHKRRLKVIKT
jgi:hypothetical protein